MWRRTNPMLQRALALTRQGKVAQATRLIQDALGAPAKPAPGDRAPVRAQATVVEPAVPLASPASHVSRDGTPSHMREARTTRGVHRVGADELPYEVHVPSTFVEGEGALVVLLHGCKQNAGDFARGTAADTHAERFGCVVLYPEQTTRANATRCWNWFDAAHQRSNAGEPGLIASLTQEIASTYRVKPGRVFIAGLSAGGAMAAILAAEHPELFAAVGVHSGLAPGAAHDLPSAFAAMAGKAGPMRADAALSRVRRMIVFHGDQDRTVAPANLAHLAEGFLAGREVTVTHTTAEEGGRRCTRSVYRDASQADVLETWLVHGLAHAWSGGSSAGSYTDPGGPDATAAMLYFFHSG